MAGRVSGENGRVRSRYGRVLIGTLFFSGACQLTGKLIERKHRDVANERGVEQNIEVVVELHNLFGKFCVVLMQLVAEEVANVAVDLVKVPICHRS